MNRSIWTITTAVAIVLLLTQAALADPILTTSGGPQPPEAGLTGDATIGWAFETGASPITVVALDSLILTQTALFGEGPNVGATTVRLYDGLGNIIASATVSTADPMETAGLSYYAHGITPVTLAANNTYYIAEDYQVGYLYALPTITPSMTNGATYVGGVSEWGIGGMPTDNLLDPNRTDVFLYFGPNFDAAPSAVPEPSTMTVVGVAAITGLGYFGWRRRISPG